MIDWAYCKNGYRKDDERNNKVKTNYSKKDWQTEIKMGGSCQSKYGKNRDRELE